MFAPMKARTEVPPHSDEVCDLADKVGDFIQYWGFKRLHGRVWCHIFLSPDGLTVAQLMGTLGVTKGLLSIAINELVEFKVIHADRKIKNGAVVYKSNSNLNEAIVDILRSRERKMLAEIWSAYELLKRGRKAGAHTSINAKNFRELEVMIISARKALDFLVFSAGMGPNIFDKVRKLV